MITGHVRDSSPLVTLWLPGVNGRFAVEFVVDTEFEGELAIPERVVRRMEATFDEERFVLMASGREEICSVYSVDIEWQGDLRTVEVLALPGSQLLGMMLLNESSLYIEGSEGGEVLIEPL